MVYEAPARAKVWPKVWAGCGKTDHHFCMMNIIWQSKKMFAGLDYSVMNQ